MKTTFSMAIVCALICAAGCSGSAAPTQAPPITGKVKAWTDMSKSEKIALIEKQPIPASAKADEIKKINLGQD